MTGCGWSFVVFAAPAVENLTYRVGWVVKSQCLRKHPVVMGR